MSSVMRQSDSARLDHHNLEDVMTPIVNSIMRAQESLGYYSPLYLILEKITDVDPQQHAPPSHNTCAYNRPHMPPPAQRTETAVLFSFSGKILTTNKGSMRKLFQVLYFCASGPHTTRVKMHNTIQHSQHVDGSQEDDDLFVPPPGTTQLTEYGVSTNNFLTTRISHGIPPANVLNRTTYYTSLRKESQCSLILCARLSLSYAKTSSLLLNKEIWVFSDSFPQMLECWVHVYFFYCSMVQETNQHCRWNLLIVKYGFDSIAKCQGLTQLAPSYARRPYPSCFLHNKNRLSLLFQMTWFPFLKTPLHLKDLHTPRQIVDSLLQNEINESQTAYTPIQARILLYSRRTMTSILYCIPITSTHLPVRHIQLLHIHCSLIFITHRPSLWILSPVFHVITICSRWRSHSHTTRRTSFTNQINAIASPQFSESFFSTRA